MDRTRFKKRGRYTCMDGVRVGLGFNVICLMECINVDM